MNTYKKHGGRGVIVNQVSDKEICPERAQRAEGSLIASDRDFYPEEHRDEGPLQRKNRRHRSSPGDSSLLASRATSTLLVPRFSKLSWNADHYPLLPLFMYPE